MARNGERKMSAGKFMTVAELIDNIGGTCSVARSLKLDPRNVSNWKALKRVSREYAPAVFVLAADKGIDARKVLSLPDRISVTPSAEFVEIVPTKRKRAA